MSNSDLARFSGKKFRDCDFGIYANILETDKNKKYVFWRYSIF